jgi:hypothetical protein
MDVATDSLRLQWRFPHHAFIVSLSFFTREASGTVLTTNSS